MKMAITWAARATKNSTATWQVDLESLFHCVKDCFPDVVWHAGIDDETEDLCGHEGEYDGPGGEEIC